MTRRTPNIECYGAYVYNPETKRIDTLLSRVTVIATGGVGAVYASTTNPNIATGDGIAMAYRAKATVRIWSLCSFTRQRSIIQKKRTGLFNNGGNARLRRHPALARRRGVYAEI